jgi:hypothetical protein
MQSLQALADIDFMHEKEREVVQSSALNARQKEKALGRLQWHYGRQCRFHVRALGSLEFRIAVEFHHVSDGATGTVTGDGAEQKDLRPDTHTIIAETR